MKHKNSAAPAATVSAPKTKFTGAKLSPKKDLCKVIDYFRYNVGTSLDCALATGIMRNCVTWYIWELERDGVIGIVKTAPDRSTGYKAKHYSADRRKWQQKPLKCELDLFPQLFKGKGVSYGE